MDIIKQTERNNPINVANMVDTIKYRFPKEWRKYCPRIYKNVEGWFDYRLPACLRISALAATPYLPKSSSLTRDILNIFLGEKYDFPMFFVGREILQACLATEPLDVVDGSNIPLPFPTMTFIMPRNSLSVAGDHIHYIDVFRFDPDNIAEITNGAIVTDKPCLSIYATTCSGGVYMRNLSKVFRNKDFKPSDDPILESMSFEEIDFTDKLCVLVFNLLYAMAAKPEYVESGHKIGRHKKSNSEIWSPNIVGRKFAVKRAAEAGTHASPRTHWRRGHFRHQPFGKGLTEHKIIWLEPMLIGATAQN